MQHLHARALGAFPFEWNSRWNSWWNSWWNSVKSHLHFWRELVWSAVVIAAVVVGLLGINALRVQNSAPKIGDGYDVNTWYNNNVNSVEDVRQVGRAFRSHSVTRAFRTRYLNAHLKCFSESGKWVYDPTPRLLPWNLAGELAGIECDDRFMNSMPGINVFGEQANEIAARGDSANWKVREPLKWVWQTNESCPWQSVNRDEFCRMMGSNGHAMVVGDSLNHEIFWSFTNALILGNRSTTEDFRSTNGQFILGPHELCGDVLGRGKSFNLSFVRNDRLSLVTTVTGLTDFYVEYPWMNLLQKRGVKLLFLNRGAHYEADPIFAAALREAFTMLSLEFPDILVIYRNTQPGHANCMTHSRPLLNPPSEPEAVPGWNFHWEDFARQNLIAKEITEDFGYIYMDSHAMLSLRPDGHLRDDDCLHYCIPGPLDIVTEYLYNILSLIRDLDVI